MPSDTFVSLDPDEILRRSSPSLDGEHQWFRQPGQQFPAETRIDVEERRAGNRARAILPGVISTPLHDHIPRLQDYLTIIKNQDEFALDHHHIVPSATLHVGYLQVRTLESRFLFTVGKV